MIQPYVGAFEHFFVPQKIYFLIGYFNFGFFLQLKSFEVSCHLVKSNVFMIFVFMSRIFVEVEELCIRVCSNFFPRKIRFHKKSLAWVE